MADETEDLQKLSGDVEDALWFTLNIDERWHECTYDYNKNTFTGSGLLWEEVEGKQ